MSESALMLDWITRKHREWENTVTDLEFEEWVKEEEFLASPLRHEDDPSDLRTALATAIDAINAVNESKCGVKLDVNGHELAVVVRRGDASVDFTAMMRMKNPNESPEQVRRALALAKRSIVEMASGLQRIGGVVYDASPALDAIKDALESIDGSR